MIPAGMRLCPDCNGEGEVWVMDATPDMNEHVYPCETCVNGLVPITEGDPS
jgi:hypothetical protein